MIENKRLSAEQQAAADRQRAGSGTQEERQLAELEERAAGQGRAEP